MGHLELEKNKQAVLFDTTGFEEEKEKKEHQQKHETHVKTDTENYYERILKNSRDQNTALRIKSYDMAEKGEWSVPEVKRRPAFRQKLPAARDSYKERRAEKAAKSEARRTFADADLCTVREKASLEAYFGRLKSGELGIAGEDNAGDPALTEYVDSILNMELNNAVFTDDYLSDHIAELWEYVRKLGNYSNMKEKYPNYFAHLTDERKAQLETRAGAVTELRTLMKQHMNLHGLVVDYDNKGFRVKLRRVEDEEKSTRTLKAEYERSRDRFLNRRVYEDEVNLARTYITLESFRSETAKEEMEGRLSSNAKAQEVCGDEIKAASTEIENAWRVRDGLLLEQQSLLRRYDDEQNEEKKAELRVKIVQNNSRIRLASQHADHYRDFLDFVTGAVYTVKKGTARFLETENQTEMLDLIRIRAMGDFIEEALVGSQKMENRKKIARLKKDIEVKESDKVEGFEVIDIKKESADEIRMLEEAVKNMTYVRMPLDLFYTRISDYKDLRSKRKRYKEQEKAGKERTEATEKTAKRYAEKFGIEAIGCNDRFLPLFCEPLQKEEKKSVHTGLTSTELFGLFTGYEDNEDLPSDIREEIRGRGKSFLEELMSITPEKMLQYRCPDHPDAEDPEFWHKRSIVMALNDIQSTLNCFKQWNIPLTDEQYAHINGLSSMAQGMVMRYGDYDKKMEDPISVVVEDERLRGDTLEKLYDNIAYPYRTGDDRVPKDREVHERLKRFGEKRSGLTMNIFMDSKRRDTNVLKATSFYLYERHIFLCQSMVTGDIEDYRKKRDEQLNEADKGEFNEEKEKMQEFFPDAGDQETETRLLKKEMDLLRKTALTEEQEKAWKLYFGDNSGAGDLRSFSSLLRPLKYDVQGVLTEESREDMLRNREDIRDYLSGDTKRRNRVLRRIGKEIASFNITDEMLTFDYMKKNHTALFPMVEKIHNFQNIWKEFPDFYESDAFTEEERDKLRLNVTGSTLLSNFCLAYGQFCNSFMGEGNMRNNKEMTKEEKQNWGRNIANSFETISRSMIETDGPDGVAGAKKIRDRRAALYADKDKADKIRRASVLWAKTKAELEKVTRSRGEITRKANYLPEGARKEEKIKKLALKTAECDDQIKKLTAKLALSDEILSFVYEEKEDLSADARTLFDTEMKESVIHVEYSESHDEKADRLQEDSARHEADYNEAFKKMQQEKEIRKAAEQKAGNLARDALTAALAELEGEKASLETEEHKVQDEPLEKQKTNEQEQSLNKAEVLQPIVKAPEYHAEASLANGTVYEPQGYLNCWACSGAALFNKFVELSDGQLTEKVNQYDIRGFKPGKGELKTLEEVNAISGLNLDKEWYDTNLEELNKFMGKDAKHNGSIFEAADFFMKKRKDFALNQMEFRLGGGMEKKDIEAYEAQKNLFMKQVNDVLKTGNLVAFYKSAGNHYVTITGIDGDNITYMDSLVDPGKPASVVTEPAEVLFSRDNSGNNMSITWFSKLKSPEEMKQDYPDLTYDEHAGYSYGRQEELQAGALNLAQTRGICITRSKSDPVLGKDAVKHHIYIPKLGDEPVQNMQQNDGQQMQQNGGQQMQHGEKKEEKSGQQQEEEEKRRRIEKGVVLNNGLYTQANKSAVKKGKFSKEFLIEGEKFMKSVDHWADRGNEQEKAVVSNMGIRDTVDMLYVSGVPIRKFVAERYAYEGDDVKILRAYAAMIAGRQKYPIVLARPVLNEKNEVDVMIEALNIDSKSLGAKKSGAGSEAYKKAQEDAKKKVRYDRGTGLKLRGAVELRKINNNPGSIVLNILEKGMEGLVGLSEGAGFEYYNAVEHVWKYYTALQEIYADEKSKMIDKTNINELTFRIIQANSKTAVFNSSLRNKNTKKKRKSDADNARIKALDGVLEILEAHDKKYRDKDLNVILQIPDQHINIDKIL